MHHLQKQKGMTAIGWLIVLGLIAFFVLIALKLIPMYLEYGKVSTVLESLTREPGLATKTRSDVIKLISKRFDINDVTTVAAKQAKVTKQDGVMIIRMNYERREPFAGNIDLVGKFDKEVRIPVR